MELEASSSAFKNPSLDSSLAYLVWEDLSVVLPSKGKGSTRRLLHGLNGYCEPCRILAIMGPSGSGKSTLLDALAGRLASNVIQTGEILLNGSKMRVDYGVVAYVTQENVLLGTLTVRETITYSAHLRLPSCMNKSEIEEVAENTIAEMGLQECADRAIGNWHMRGISGGEKKRLSITLEILTRPRILFLDEPTTGLDSASAFSVVQTLRSIAQDGKTVIFSIHQPSSEVFALFDDLYLLSGGEIVYFGDAKLATQFFAEAGFPCPSRRNPSDHLLRCINSDFDLVNATMRGSKRFLTCLETSSSADPLLVKKTAEIKAMLIAKYKASTYSVMTCKRMREILNIEGLIEEKSRGSHATWWKQMTTLTRRSSLNMSRDIGYYWLRIMVYIVVAICVGTIFFNVGSGRGAVLARGSCGGFISGFMTFMSIGGFPSFIEEMKVFHAERLNGHYGVAVYTLSNFLSSFPFLVVISSSSASIAYYMVKFRAGLIHFAYFSLTLFGCIAVVESIMMVVAALVPNFLMGIITGAGVMGIMMMTAGFFRLLPDLPKPIWRYPLSYLSYGSWALQGQYKNDMIGLVFDPILPGGPRVSGDYILTHQLGISTRRSKWWDLAALFMLVVAYRFLFLFVLKFKERSVPQMRKIFAKRTLRRLQRRPSFAKKPPSTSSSCGFPLHPLPLSAQEGLSSPIT